jgi:hypothetical protein
MLSTPATVFGPVLVPPWIRHLPLAMAGDPHGVPLRRFLAPHRGAALAALRPFFQVGSQGFLLDFIFNPSAGAPGDDSLTTTVDVDVLYGDRLCSTVPELVKCKSAFLEGVHHAGG